MSHSQLQLPYQIIDPSDIAGVAASRGMFNRGMDTYWIEFKMLSLRPGFNPRMQYVGIEELAEKIISNGLTPLTVDVLKDGSVLVEKGHRRFKALTLLAQQRILQKLDVPGIRLGKVLCLVNPKEVTELDRIKNALSDNDSEPLTPVEQADCIWRMKYLFQLSTDEIKAATGLSRQHIDNRLSLADQSDFVKDCIKKGLVKPTSVTRLAAVVKTPERVSDLIEGMTKSKKAIRGNDVEELIRQEKKETERPDETFDETREEIAWCQNVIRLTDKIATIVDRSENEQTQKDVGDVIRWIQTDMEKIRDYVKKHKRK